MHSRSDDWLGSPRFRVYAQTKESNSIQTSNEQTVYAPSITIKFQIPSFSAIMNLLKTNQKRTIASLLILFFPQRTPLLSCLWIGVSSEMGGGSKWCDDEFDESAFQLFAYMEHPRPLMACRHLDRRQQSTFPGDGQESPKQNIPLLLVFSLMWIPFTPSVSVPCRLLVAG